MNKDELFRLGKIVRTFGSKGEVVFQVDSDILAGLKKMESVFLNLNENLVPFFIESLQPRAKNQALVKFLDICNTEDATAIAGSEIYIPIGFLPKAKGKQLFSFDIEGFIVKDSLQGEIGIVVTVLDMPQQSLLSVEFKGKEILIPIVEEIVKKVDRKNKTIFIDAPDGLIDLYLG